GSGVLATLTAGLIIGNMGPLGALTERGREAVEALWEYIAFVVNSLVFLLIGIHLAHHRLVPFLRPEVTAIGLVMLARAIAVSICCALFARSAQRVEIRHQHVLFWGGLRGALALALALSLPPTAPNREAIVTAAFAVVAFTVIVPGLTITQLLRRMGD